MPFSLQHTIYIQLSPERITARNIHTGEHWSDTPHIALAERGRKVILAVGSNALLAAQEPGVTVHNPLGHPRTLVSDFTLTEQLMKYALAKVGSRGLFRASPKVLVHPLGDPEGGLAQVEIRALRELALGGGAARSLVWQGPPLSDQEIASRNRPREGELLN